MRIAIVGHGFVGKAVDYGFPGYSYIKCLPSTGLFPDMTELSKITIDPPLYGNGEEDLRNFKPDAVFLCLPTPMKDGDISYDLIESWLKYCPEDTVVILKSTVPPFMLKKLLPLHSRIVYNPEFLCERSANHDFVNPPMLVLGGHEKDCEFVESLYEHYSICNRAPVVKVDALAASMIKMTINCFLAMKVTFFNEMYDFFKETGTTTSWETFVGALVCDPRIGDSHMMVPGPDGKRGFGGACFPGNVRAILQDDAMNAFDGGDVFTHLYLLRKVEQINDGYRRAYEPDEREKKNGYFEKETT